MTFEKKKNLELSAVVYCPSVVNFIAQCTAIWSVVCCQVTLNFLKCNAFNGMKRNRVEYF